MTIGEAKIQYEIPNHIIEEYEQLMQYKKGSDWECSRKDLDYMGIMVTLHQIGFGEKEVATYMELAFEGESTENKRLAILNRKRHSTMDEIHVMEGQVDMLDYLRYKLQESSDT